MALSQYVTCSYEQRRGSLCAKLAPASKRSLARSPHSQVSCCRQIDSSCDFRPGLFDYRGETAPDARPGMVDGGRTAASALPAAADRHRGLAQRVQYRAACPRPPAKQLPEIARVWHFDELHFDELQLFGHCLAAPVTVRRWCPPQPVCWIFINAILLLYSRHHTHFRDDFSSEIVPTSPRCHRKCPRKCRWERKIAVVSAKHELLISLSIINSCHALGLAVAHEFVVNGELCGLLCAWGSRVALPQRGQALG